MLKMKKTFVLIFVFVGIILGVFYFYKSFSATNTSYYDIIAKISQETKVFPSDIIEIKTVELLYPSENNGKLSMKVDFENISSEQISFDIKLFRDSRLHKYISSLPDHIIVDWTDENMILNPNSKYTADYQSGLLFPLENYSESELAEISELCSAIYAEISIDNEFYYLTIDLRDYILESTVSIETPNILEEPKASFLSLDTHYLKITPSLTKSTEDEVILNLKNIYNSLTQNYDYSQVHFQFLTYRGAYTRDMKFVSANIANEEVKDSEGNDIVQTKIKSFFIGETLVDSLEQFILDGSNFETEDFYILNSDDEISVLLGYDYQDIYNIGDKITLYLHDKELSLNVIGFLEQGSSFSTEYIEPNDMQGIGNSSTNLDTRIILPFYNILYTPTDPVDAFYQKIFYLQKNEGYIALTDDIKGAENIEFELNALVENQYLEFTIPISLVKFDASIV